MTSQRFEGFIAGVGSTSGVRVVVGSWVDTPLGPFADAMVETPTGHRVLLAPHREAADFIAATYTLDEIRIGPFEVGVTPLRDRVHWAVRSPSLHLDLEFTSRTPAGRLLSLVPPSVATAPGWCALIDPFARVLLRGVRTRGTAGGDRREYYGATDARRVVRAGGHFDGADLGRLAAVDPPCRFGFSSTPRTPSVTTVTTTVRLAGGGSCL